MLFSQVEHHHEKNAEVAMRGAAGHLSAKMQPPLWADNYFTKRLETAVILAADTIKNTAPWDREDDYLNPKTVGGQRMKRSLGRVLQDIQGPEIPSLTTVEGLSRRLITDIETQSFAHHALEAIEKLDNKDEAKKLADENHPIFTIATHANNYPSERRALEMQAMAWYEHMPLRDQEEISLEMGRSKLQTDQESYLSKTSAPFLLDSGMPDLAPEDMAKAAAYPSKEQLERASSLLKTRSTNGNDATERFLAVADAALNMSNAEDLGHSLGHKEYTRSAVALARATQAVEVANAAQLPMTNLDVAAMMMMDIRKMAISDRLNIEHANEEGVDKVDRTMIAAAGGDYSSSIKQQKTFGNGIFPTVLSTESTNMRAFEHVELAQEVRNVMLDPERTFDTRGMDKTTLVEQQNQRLMPTPGGFER